MATGNPLPKGKNEGKRHMTNNWGLQQMEVVNQVKDIGTWNAATWDGST